VAGGRVLGRLEGRTEGGGWRFGGDMRRAWSLFRYASLRARDAASAASERFVKDGDVVEAWKHGERVLQEPFTRAAASRGEAMRPTIRGEKLLVRRIAAPAASNVHVDDVVLFQLPEGSEERTEVRRVVAGEGHEMLSTCEEDEPFHLPSGTCWVLADNEDMDAKQVADSRTFGPLPYRNVLGRVLYSYESELDHGIVDNSEQVATSDEVVLSQELDLKWLAQVEPIDVKR